MIDGLPWMDCPWWTAHSSFCMNCLTKFIPVYNSLSDTCWLQPITHSPGSSNVWVISRHAFCQPYSNWGLERSISTVSAWCVLLLLSFGCRMVMSVFNHCWHVCERFAIAREVSSECEHSWKFMALNGRSNLKRCEETSRMAEGP